MLNVWLLDDAGIRSPNQAIFGRAGTTDVITARYAPLPGQGGEPEAELFVNVAEALRQATAGASGGDAGRELALYLAHGMDHLAGHDDADAAARRRMRTRELGWLRAAARADLLTGLITPASAGQP